MHKISLSVYKIQCAFSLINISKEKYKGRTTSVLGSTLYIFVNEILLCFQLYKSSLFIDPKTFLLKEYSAIIIIIILSNTELHDCFLLEEEEG
jgi:hypothetical protein